MAFGDFLNDAECDGLIKVSDDDATHPWKVLESFDAKRLGGLQSDEPGLSAFESLRVLFQNLSSEFIHLLQKLRKFHGDVRSVDVTDCLVAFYDGVQHFHDYNKGDE